MKVIHIIDTLRSGGRERQLVELLKGLSSTSEVECELIVMSDEIHYMDLYKLDVTVHTLLRKTKRDISVFFRLYRLLRERRPNILHSWGSMCSIYALPAIKLLNLKFIEGSLRNAPPSLSVFNKYWIQNKITFPFSDAIVSNSRAGLKAYSAPKNKSHCIYNGFDFNRINQLPGEELTKRKYQVNTKYVIGMVASFSDYKDFPTFIEAAKIVLQKRKDVTFLAIGDGKNRRECMDLVPGALKDFVRFCGKIEEIEPLVQLMTIGVLISNANLHGEGISNSIMEYMAFGKPVVATDCGGNRELILEGESGYFVENGDAVELADRLISILDNEVLLRKLGSAGSQRLQDVFSLERMTQDYVALYTELFS